MSAFAIMTKSEAKDYLNARIQRVVLKYTDHLIGTKVQVTKTRHLHKLSVVVDAGPIYSVFASATSTNLYEGIEKVVQRVEKQLQRRQNKSLKKQNKRNPFDGIDVHAQEPYSSDEELVEEFLMEEAKVESAKEIARRQNWAEVRHG